MRVSTSNRFDATVDSLQRRQRDLADAQMQMSSGKRISRPSDDPAAVARVERMRVAQLRIEAEQRSVQISRAAMVLAESALGQAGELMQSARETIVAAGNPVYDATQRQALAEQLRQLRSQLLQLANQHDGAYGYTFGGNGSASAPIREVPAGAGSVTYDYNGLTGDRMASGPEPMPLQLDADRIWLQAHPGGGIFGVLDAAIRVLGDPASTQADVTSAVDTGLRDIDEVMAHMQSARAVAGATLSRLDSIDSRNQDRDLWSKSVQSEAEDIDMVQAISEFQSQQTGYQAALQSYALVQRMSLFDYIK